MRQDRSSEEAVSLTQVKQIGLSQCAEGSLQEVWGDPLGGVRRPIFGQRRVMRFGGERSQSGDTSWQAVTASECPARLSSPFYKRETRAQSDSLPPPACSRPRSQDPGSLSPLAAVVTSLRLSRSSGSDTDEGHVRDGGQTEKRRGRNPAGRV